MGWTLNHGFLRKHIYPDFPNNFMPFDLSSLGFFDNDIYNTVLQDILGVRPTGDAVADAVYLLVLPLLTLYLLSDHVAVLFHAGKTKLKWVFMAIVFFFVIQRGFYPIVAKYSLFAFIVLLAWGALTFILGRRYDEKSGKPQDFKAFGTEGSGVSSGIRGTIGNIATITNPGTAKTTFKEWATGGKFSENIVKAQEYELIERLNNPNISDPERQTILRQLESISKRRGAS